MQSSNGHYSMHQEVPIVFLLVLFVCPNTVCYDYVENSMGSCWRKDIFKGQRSSINHKIKLFL